MTLYRVIEKTTTSLQPSGTFWNRNVLYCGYDREEARRVYHEQEPADIYRGYGSTCRETIAQAIEDSGEDFGEDKITRL